MNCHLSGVVELKAHDAMTSESARRRRDEGKLFRLELELARTPDENQHEPDLHDFTAAVQGDPKVEVIRKKLRVLLVTAQNLDTDEDYSSTLVK